jgi:hemolysin-activating ACP:hemolysin acyltransferase
MDGVPPVTYDQFYVVEAMDKKHGFRAPIAAVTWAFVSEELDQQFQRQAAPFRRLRPDQWKSGEVAWLIGRACRRFAHGAPLARGGAVQGQAAEDGCAGGRRRDESDDA